MAAKKILVPYNFTANDEKAIDLVIQNFSQHPDTRVTLFHVYLPVPNIEVSDRTVMSRISGNLSYLRQKINDLEAEIVKARDRLIDAGFPRERVNYTFKAQDRDAAQEIIEQAINGEFTGIVLNRSPASIRKFFTPSVSKRVVRALQHLELYMVG
jgi:hypothetical protein